MGYRALKIDDLFELYRRWADGQSARSLARIYGFDRKTVEKYVHRFKDFDLSPNAPPEVIREVLAGIAPSNRKPAPAFAALLPFEQEIRELINRNRNPLKAKSVWLVLAEKYGIASKTSYETFKRFVRNRRLAVSEQSTTIRIETDPGEEIQIDYGFVGYRRDEENGATRKVYAFCGVLSFCRLPFVRFSYAQNQTSFTESHVTMFTFYGGAAKRINLDNLKTGVLKAHVTDPAINKSYADLCAYYGVFVDPCRPASPKEKGKIERFIPQARELFRRLLTLHPGENLETLSERAQNWCLADYGEKPHGTTHIPPGKAFSLEQPALRPLPARPFEVPRWTVASVHPDQFIAVDKKYYSLPKAYVGKKVAVRVCGAMVRIFFEEKEIRTYVVPRKSRAFYDEDFPEASRAMMNGTYPAYLVRTARERFGDAAAELVTRVLTPNANLNARRALALISLFNDYRDLPLFSSVIREALEQRITSAAYLKTMFDDERKQRPFPFVYTISDEGRVMTRDISYYLS